MSRKQPNPPAPKQGKPTPPPAPPSTVTSAVRRPQCICVTCLSNEEGATVASEKGAKVAMEKVVDLILEFSPRKIICPVYSRKVFPFVTEALYQAAKKYSMPVTEISSGHYRVAGVLFLALDRRELRNLKL